jgi:teichoic acid transport system ATP-binding protein
MSNTVIVKNVYKKYKMHTKPSEKLLDVILPGGYGEDFYALQNISFTAKRGDVIGLVGVNGSGKSTLSNIIAGVMPPTSGMVETVGQTSLIAIASGQIKEMEPEIIDFADIGKFIDQPVKKYSSGMKSRLGFAISVTVDPDILVIDEALSVGDQAFAQKSKNKMFEFKEKGKTIFFVSHSMGQVKEFCESALWLEYGEIKQYGPVNEVIPEYEKFLKWYKSMTQEEQKKFREEVMRKQSGPVAASNN